MEQRRRGRGGRCGGRRLFSLECYQGSAGALSAGLGNASPYAAASITAAAENGLTQGIGIVAGLQSQFSWQQVALSAVAAPAARYVGGEVTGIAQSAFAGYVAAGITSALIRTSAGGKLNAQSILADAFGNAIGDSIADAYRPEALSTPQPEPASGPSAAPSAPG